MVLLGIFGQSDEKTTQNVTTDERMKNNEKLHRFYEDVQGSGLFRNLPDYNRFAEVLADRQKAEQFYDRLRSSDSFTGIPETFDEFSRALGLQYATPPLHSESTAPAFPASQSSQLTPEEIFQQKVSKMASDGWREAKLKVGQLPDCYSMMSKKGNLDNYLEVYVGGVTDAVVKVVEYYTETCVRCVFVANRTRYRIRNIPEGEYYLKVAYGRSWFSKFENGKCVGKFLRSPLYEKGEDILDFSVQHRDDGYSIPSFKLELSVIETEDMDNFDTHGISEDEFNL